MTTAQFLFRSAALWTAASVAIAGGVGFRPLKILVPGADVIVIGMTSRAVVSGNVARFSVNVERILKGEGDWGSTISVVADLPPGTRVPAREERGLLFLKRTGGGALRLVPILTGDMGELSRMYYVLPKVSRPATMSATNDVWENVFLELLAAQEQGGVQHQRLEDAQRVRGRPPGRARCVRQPLLCPLPSRLRTRPPAGRNSLQKCHTTSFSGFLDLLSLETTATHSAVLSGRPADLISSASRRASRFMAATFAASSGPSIRTT